ncbi:hypothetical protein ACRALDRAFT_1068526 [Sodiomyces alcalophilus JCM 7366]|uniref:uncharacterized protein n=1 Tax=Sodiomyces alcalophilus JCM 7366 TaxID=591952 RepID=UPI0039B6011D
MASHPYHKLDDLAHLRYPNQAYLRLPDDFITVNAVPSIYSVDGPDGPDGPQSRSGPSLPQYSAYGRPPHYHQHNDEPTTWTTRSKQRWKTSTTKLRHALTVRHRQSPIATCFAYAVVLLLFVLWIVSLFRLVWT